MRAKCTKCLLPAQALDADLDEAGVCRWCRDADRGQTNQESEIKRREFLQQFEETVAQCRGHGEYDCLVPFSGGKDSCYLLYKLKVEYKLNVLAFTVNVSIPALAWQNIQRSIEKLEIDHLSYQPPRAFYRKLFRYLLMNQEARGAVYTVSYVYAPLFEGDAIKLAIEKDIPLILAGYSPGQPEPERMLFEFSGPLITATDWTPPHLRACGEFSAAELARFYNPANLPAGTAFPRYLAPFHAWPYNQEEVMAAVVEHGLVATKRHANPIFSNYPINWLLMYSDLKNFGYNPYAPEFAALIRDGKASRTYWQVMAPIVDGMIRHKQLLGRHTASHMKWLDLRDEDLRITLPKGAYDPPGVTS